MSLDHRRPAVFLPAIRLARAGSLYGEGPDEIEVALPPPDLDLDSDAFPVMSDAPTTVCTRGASSPATRRAVPVRHD